MRHWFVAAKTQQICDIATGLLCSRVTVCDYPDGRIEIEYRGIILPYKTFDKIREVNRAEIVENKRLGPALELAAKMQAEREIKRSKRTPRRRGQGEHMFSTKEQAQLNQ